MSETGLHYIYALLQIFRKKRFRADCDRHGAPAGWHLKFSFGSRIFVECNILPPSSSQCARTLRPLVILQCILCPVTHGEKGVRAARDVNDPPVNADPRPALLTNLSRSRETHLQAARESFKSSGAFKNPCRTDTACGR